MYKKEYSQLTFADDYMFCKILSSNKDLCKELLELTLGIRITRLEITENQVSMEYKYDPDILLGDEATKVIINADISSNRSVR